MLPEPCTANRYLAEHVALLDTSLKRWRGRGIADDVTPERLAHFCFTAPFALLSHDDAPDPLFTYGNATAMRLFGMEWAALITTPSRYSAEALEREDRQRLLARVNARGYIDDYSGIRISAGGQRFRIEQAVVWNLIDAAGDYRGQAAMFEHWTMLP